MKGYPTPRTETTWERFKSRLMANKIIFKSVKWIISTFFTVTKSICGSVKWINSTFFTANAVINVSVLFIVLLLLAIGCRMSMETSGVTEHQLDALLGIIKSGGASAKYQTLRALGVTLLGTAVILGLAFTHKRTRAQEGIAKEQFYANETQFQANRDRIYNKAIEHLGHESASVRLGGISALYKLSKLERDKEILKSIAEILCGHLRETTHKKGYQKDYENEPSKEIQSLLSFLSKLNANYQKRTPGKLLDLSKSYLNGADLRHANLQLANLTHVVMQDADLSFAKMQGARLVATQMQGANLSNAQMQEANLSGAHMQYVNLVSVEMKDANLTSAKMHNANLFCAQLRGSSLPYAQMQGVNLCSARMKGVALYHAQMQAADLSYAQMQGSNLCKAQMQGANLSEVKMKKYEIDKTQMQGAFAKKTESKEWRYLSFEERIEIRRNKNTELESMVWDSEEELDIDKMSAQKDKGPNYQIPKHAIIAVLDEDTADKILQDYKKAMKSILLSRLKKRSYQLLKKVITGVLDEDTADKILQDYKEVIKSVSLSRFKEENYPLLKKTITGVLDEDTADKILQDYKENMEYTENLYDLYNFYK